MIFVSVGTQLPFDRLISAIDTWAGNNPPAKVIAQIGNSSFTPKNIEYSVGLSPEHFRKNFNDAEIVISHAGIGNVLLALELKKPIIIVPRRAALNEHRNDHQMATAKWLDEKLHMKIVYDIAELDSAIKTVANTTQQVSFSPYASDELLNSIRTFINS